MEYGTYHVGMIGLGVMGRNLALNIADNGFSVAGHDVDGAKMKAFDREAEGRPVRGFLDVAEFSAALRHPRNIVIMVPAGRPVDMVIDALLPVVAPGDLLVDAGNSHFKDTETRARKLKKRKILYMGVGVSGGERGARTGPSIMPGGPLAAYDRVRTIFETIAAKVNGEPCVSYMGPGSAGHYVKMVHNGIEYALMEIIAESYDLMKRGLGLANDRIHAVFSEWSTTVLKSYLMEITARIFEKKDEGGRLLLDVILDQGEGKGTGKWMCQDAMELGVPVAAIGEAVAMRDLSARREERRQASMVLGRQRAGTGGDARQPGQAWTTRLAKALETSAIIIFAQAFAQLRAASNTRKYNLDLAEVARIWRGGCIIRSALLEPIRRAFLEKRDLANLLLDPALSEIVMEGQRDLRQIVCFCVEQSIPTPGLSSCLAYFDSFRSLWLPASLLQAQRDYFGSHMYRRIDKEGLFHTEWEE